MDKKKNVFTEVKDAIDLINAFTLNPIKAIQSYYLENGLKETPIVLNPDDHKRNINSLDNSIKRSIDILSGRLDKLNFDFIKNYSKQITADDTFFIHKPLRRVGIYAPYKMPSTVYTFLSAAKSAGVEELVVFLPVNKKDGSIDPASVYAAQRYNAEVLCGPSKYGFPLLAYGIDGIVKKCDKITGPCGAFINNIKQVTSITGECDIDMSAGPSELVLATDNLDRLNQIKLDLLSQLEHGPDSKAYLILIDKELSFENSEFNTELKNKRIEKLSFKNWDSAIDFINDLGPETVVVYSKETETIKEKINFAGVLYLNTINSLGDYGAIGRGCADPTGKMAKSQSGISPLSFMKLLPVVESKRIDEEFITSSLVLSEYEGLYNHQSAIKNYLT